MYGLIGQMRVVAGRRNELVAILRDATGGRARREERVP